MALTARGFQLTPDILGGLGRGVQFGTGLQNLMQQRQQQSRQQQIQELLSGAVAPTPAPQTPQQAMLAEQTAELAPVSEQAAMEQPRVIPQEQLIAQARRIDPVMAEQTLKQLGLDEPSRRAEASRFAARMQSLPPELQNQEIMQRVTVLQSQGRNPSDTMQLLDMDPAQRAQALQGIQLLDLSTRERMAAQERAQRGLETPADQRAFEKLLEGLPEEEKVKARKIKLGLQPRAVGSADQTITEQGLADEVGKTKAIIGQREKFGRLTGESRAKAIDKGIMQINRIDQGINTLDRAVNAIEAGAGTGAIERFLPSIRAASIELDNIRNQLALDVIGGVTLGAISEAELELAKQVALPTGLDRPQLLEHLRQRRAAQEKLRNYFNEQIQFLDQGGTVAGFLRMKERQQNAGQPAAPGAAPAAVPGAAPSAAPATTMPQGGQIRFLGFE